LWTIKSPKIQQAFNAYNNFRYQNCLYILKDSISTIKPSKEFDWLEIELRIMSWVQLGAVEKIHRQIVELRKSSHSPNDLDRLELLSAITGLWTGEEDSRLSAKKLRKLRSKWKLRGNYNLEISAQICHLAYLWHEERLEDMSIPLRNLEKKLSKVYALNHPAWNTYHVYKILVHTMKYEAQNRYILPLFRQIKQSTSQPVIHNAIYTQAVKGFCYIHKGETSRGLRHLESALGSFEKYIGSSSPFTLQFGIKLGNLLWQHNQFSAAYDLGARLHKVCNKTFGGKSQTTIKYRILLAKCMLRMRRTGEAFNLLKTTLDALNMKKEIRLAAQIHLQLLRLFLEQDKFLNAEKHLGIGRQIASRHFHPNHPIIKEYQLLGVTLKNRKNSTRVDNLNPIKTIHVE
tara:strand:+ start:1123 stop:2328 length:1206 start_codon:yes stop_codon:yes gene_type:complete